MAGLHIPDPQWRTCHPKPPEQGDPGQFDSDDQALGTHGFKQVRIETCQDNLGADQNDRRRDRPPVDCAGREPQFRQVSQCSGHPGHHHGRPENDAEQSQAEPPAVEDGAETLAMDCQAIAEDLLARSNRQVGHLQSQRADDQGQSQEMWIAQRGRDHRDDPPDQKDEADVHELAPRTGADHAQGQR